MLKKKDRSIRLNNWELHGYKSKEEAMLTAIALVVRGEDVLIAWNDQTWTRDSFSREFLKKVEVKDFSSRGKGRK